MTSRGAERSEGEATPRPTDLHLYQLSSKERLRLNVLRDRARELGQIFRSNVDYRVKVFDDFERHRTNIENLRDEEINLGWEYTSHRTAPVVLARFLDDFSSRGYSQDQIISLFKLCFTINSKHHESVGSPRDPERIMRVLIQRGRTGKQTRNELVRKMAGNPPAWFKRSPEEWIHLIDFYSRFYPLLNPDVSGGIYKVGQLGYTSLQNTPDWMDELDNRIPSREELTKQLEDDTEEQELVLDHLEATKRERSQLVEYFSKRQIKSGVRSEEFRRDFFPKVSTLADLSLYLWATEYNDEFEVDLSKWEDLTSEQMNKTTLDPQASREKSIRIFAQDLPPSTDLMALWLERKFKEAGLAASTVIDPELARRLGLFTDDTNADLRALRDTDKKFFNTFNYDLKPLLRILPEDEQDYYRELVQASEGETLESIIWEIAYLLSNRLSMAEGPAAEKANAEISRFSANWLRNNWQWAYSELEDVLKNGLVVVEIPRPESLVEQPVEIEVDNQDLEDDREEVALLTREVEEGNLSDWRVYYTANMRVQNGAELIELGGRTLEEKEAVLEEILLREGAQVSIKDSSIINALDWIVVAPPEIFYRRPVIEVNGEDFIKAKRGGVRILFQIDRDRKELAFFLYHKKLEERL